ncbi:MAG: hypothetical protein ACHQ3P_01655 [Candidatus Limnocylindrales bacterium]
MRGLLTADAYRLRRRPEIWLIAIAIPLFGALGFINAYYSVPQHYFFDGPTAPPDIVAAIAAEQGTFAFPLSVLRMLDDTIWVAIATFFFVCTSIGAEFPWGTIRTALLARSDRAAFLVSRLAWFAAIGAGMVAVLVLVGAIMPTILRALGESPTAPISVETVDLVAVVASRLVLVGFTISLGAFLTLITRNAALAFLIALVVVLADLIVAGNDALHHSDALAAVARSMPVTSLIALLDQTSTMAQGGEPPPADPNYIVATFPLWLSFAVPLAWTLLAGGAAIAIIRRADISE